MSLPRRSAPEPDASAFSGSAQASSDAGRSRRLVAADRRLSQRLRAIAHERAFERVELHVGHRHEQQRQEQAQRLAADDGHGNCGAAGAADAEAQRGRDQAGDDRGGRHQDRPQPRAAGFDDGLADRQPARPQHVGVVDLQDRVLLHDPEQQQHAERAPEVERCAPVIHSVNSANGTAIGSTSMITIGCRKLSNCDASTM